MSPTAHLAVINLFVGDIQGGLGPFLSTWLAQAGHWSPDRIGLVTTIVGLATLLLNGPAGALADRTGRPRALLLLACTGILGGTLMLLIARSFWSVLLAQFVAASGGTLVVPALTSLTLGIVGKAAFPHQQGRNQAFNHAGILSAGLLVSGGARLIGPQAGFLILAAMALAALVAIATTPRRAWNGRRAHGWREDEPDEAEPRHPMLAVLANRKILLLSVALALFNLANGGMLSLIGQRLVGLGYNATSWVAVFVIVAQLTMIPVALWAGSRATRRGRRHLLLIACAVQVVRALLSAVATEPAWVIPAEILDGIASGLLGVAVPVLVADLSWGSGQTQTTLGMVNALQGIGGALSNLFGGLMVQWVDWNGAFVALAVPAAGAFAIALWVEETQSKASPYLPLTTAC